jgi:hydrogenase maturation protease
MTTSSRTLVAGIGNVFLGDDGFGVEVVRRLSEHPSRTNVSIVDFGIRGVDLTYALLDGYDRVILVDAAPHGRAPGTLYVIEPDLSGQSGPLPQGLETHGLVPVQALAMAQAMGGRLSFVRVVGCEPAHVPAGDDIAVGLSPPVAAAVEPAVSLIEELLEAPHA